MKYTVIDFETANSKRSSACALGIVVVEDNFIKEAFSYLIQPSDMYFASMNIGIHGIRPEDVIDEPTFDILYHKVFKKYIENQLVVAHNASFDMSVLRACLKEYDIPFPSCDYLCTVKVAQKLWPDLPRHALNVVSDYLGFAFSHHDAYDDARASANILIQANRQTGLTAYELADKLQIKVGKLFENGYTACSSKRF